MRFKVPKKLVGSGADDPVTLGTIALRYTGIDGEPRAIQPAACTLPVLPASAFGAISEDELVLRRVGELEAAEIQLKARHAAMNGEWDTVMRLLRKAEKLGVDNPWIAAVVVELRKLAERRDQAMFSKASAYGSRRMQSRLAVRDENVDAIRRHRPPPTCGASRTRARVTTTRRHHRRGVDASLQDRWRCQGRCRCRFVPAGVTTPPPFPGRAPARADTPRAR